MRTVAIRQWAVPIALAAWVAAALPGSAGDWFVAPDGAGDGSGWAAATNSIQGAIDGWTSGETIYLKAGVYSLMAPLSVLNKSGVVMRGGYTGSGFETGSVPSVLTRDLTVTNRILYATNSTITLDSVTVSNGLALQGAGLYFWNCAAVMTNCVVAGNTGTGTYARGAGIYVNTGSVMACGTLFQNNRLITNNDEKDGAGLYGLNAAVTLSNCVFAGNSISAYNFQYGVGLYLSGGSATIDNTRFLTNYFTGVYQGEGAALYANNVNPLAVTRCRFAGNYVGTSYNSMGVIRLNGTSLDAVLNDCVFENNHNNKVNYTDDIYLGTASRVAVLNSSFYRSSRALNKVAGAAVVGVTNCLVREMTSHGIQASAGTISIAHSTLANNGGWGVTNGAATVAMRDSIVWGNTLGGVAGAVSATYVNSQNALEGAGNLSTNPVFFPAGSYYLSATGQLGQTGDSPCIDKGSDEASVLGMDSRTTRTDGAYDTGQVDLGYHYAGGLAAISNLFLYVDPVNGLETNNGWTEQTALKTITNALGRCLRGSTIHLAAGVYSTNSGEQFPLTLPVEDLMFIGTNRDLTILDPNQADRAFTAVSMGTLWFEGFTVTNGSAVSKQGSGFYVSGSDVTITNCVLVKNGHPAATVSTFGGAIYASGGTLNVWGCVFDANGAPVHNSNNSQGGAIYATGSGVTLSGSLFRNNSMNGYDGTAGGCLYLTGGSAIIRDCRFEANYSRGYSGNGVVYLGGQTDLLVTNGVFINNKSYYPTRGAIVHVTGTGTRREIVDCVFSNGVPNEFGSAFGAAITADIGAGGSLSLLRARIGAIRGQGVYKSSSGLLGVTNSLIHACTNNGLMAVAGRVEMVNCTLADNGEWGVTNAVPAATNTVLNSIAWGNGLGGFANCASVDYSDSQNGVGGTGNKTEDPLFEDAAAGNYRLKRGSPCRNAALRQDWMSGAVDLERAPRVRGSNPDMGAFEMPPMGGTVLVVR